MTFFEAALSKYGPTLNASKSRVFCLLEPYAPGLLSFELDESRWEAEAEKKTTKKTHQKLVGKEIVYGEGHMLNKIEKKNRKKDKKNELNSIRTV